MSQFRPSVRAYHEFDRVIEEMRSRGEAARITDHNPSDIARARAGEYAALSKQINQLAQDAGVSVEQVDLDLRTASLESLSEGALSNPHYRMDAATAQWSRLILHAHAVPPSKLASAIDECGKYALESVRDPRSKELLHRSKLFDKRAESLFERVFGKGDIPGLQMCLDRVTDALKSHTQALAGEPTLSAREKVFGITREPSQEDLKKRFGYEKGKAPSSPPPYVSNSGLDND